MERFLKIANKELLKTDFAGITGVTEPAAVGNAPNAGLFFAQFDFREVDENSKLCRIKA